MHFNKSSRIGPAKCKLLLSAGFSVAKYCFIGVPLTMMFPYRPLEPYGDPAQKQAPQSTESTQNINHPSALSNINPFLYSPHSPIKPPPYPGFYLHTRGNLQSPINRLPCSFLRFGKKLRYGEPQHILMNSSNSILAAHTKDLGTIPFTSTIYCMSYACKILSS